MTYYLSIFLVLVCIIFFIGSILKCGKNASKKFDILEINPSLSTTDHDQHVRRLNKFRTSNYKGTTYFFSKKGGLYYYSKNNVRIYM